MFNGLKIILPEGAKVKFFEEKQRYNVIAADDRYAICTKPFNPKRTVLYTIVDLDKDIRGTNNLVFNIYNYAVYKDCQYCLKDLQLGLVGVSKRNCIELNFESVRRGDRRLFKRWY